MEAVKAVKVPQIKTKYRRMVTEIPVPESIPMFTALREREPRSMQTVPYKNSCGIGIVAQWRVMV